jgi:hypothetical protein
MFKRKRLAAAVASLSVASAGAAHAAFTEVTADNPFDAITSEGTRPSVVMMDLDADGDLDAVVFHEYQNDSTPYNGYAGLAGAAGTSVWENTGNASEPQFTHVLDDPTYAGSYGTGDNITRNPFAEDYAEYYGHPVSAADLEGDGDLDFFGGKACASNNRQLTFAAVLSDPSGVVTGADEYRYTTSGYGDNPFYGNVFASTAASLDQYGGCYGADFATADLDADGDIDIATTDYNILKYYRNDSATVSDNVYSYTERGGVNSPFYGDDGSALTLPDSAYFGAPIVFHDVDADGDQDMVMGTVEAADMRLFVNTGTASTPEFKEATDDSLDVSTNGWASPSFADIDSDGDDDLIVAEVNGSGTQSLRLFRNDAADPAVVGDEDDDGLFGGVGLGGLIFAGLALIFRRRR